MLTFFSSRLRFVVVPAVAAGALVALAAGANAATGDALSSSLAAVTGQCAGRHGVSHAACGSTATMQAMVTKVKAPALRPQPGRLPVTRPAQSTGTPGDRARWRQIRAALSGKTA